MLPCCPLVRFLSISIMLVFIPFLCGSSGKESACTVGDLGSILGLGRSTGEGKGYPLQYSGLEKSMDCRVHGVAKSWTWLSDFHFKPFWGFFFVWCEWVSKLHWFTSTCLAFPVPLSSTVYSWLLCWRLIDSRCVGLIWAFYPIPLIYIQK